ncbi:hypothetical protein YASMINEVIRUS_1327 [Yasminevirus sp. GU-2018]|uniref:Uncharacterized protein n=1 Tax=Yasminevirus sp. GU-2018 TaxID=2420051 RepID=A0A5K0UAR3_9VIRU|nr:hypothetical protein YASMINEVIRUS_1327 [Yasminevirus sp. GU-2018]
MTRGSNTMNARKLRRLMERQHKKGVVTDADYNQFIKEDTERSKALKIKKDHDETVKEYEVAKAELDKNIQTVKNVELPFTPAQTTMYAVGLSIVQTLIAIITYFFTRFGFVSFAYIFMLITSLIDVFKCVLMRKFPYFVGDRPELRSDESSNEVSNQNSLSESDTRFSFESVGKRVVMLDYFTAFVTLLSFSHLISFEFDMFRTIMFLVLTLYRMFTQNCVTIDTKTTKVTKHTYTKDLSVSMLIVLMCFIVYVNTYRLIFFIATSILYKDVKESIKERFGSYMQGRMSQLKSVS